MLYPGRVQNEGANGPVGFLNNCRIRPQTCFMVEGWLVIRALNYGRAAVIDEVPKCRGVISFYSELLLPSGWERMSGE